MGWENLDARNIFTACRRMKSKVDWERQSDSEWLFVGKDADFREDEVEKLIQSFFEDAEVYLVIDRHNSFPIQLNKSAEKVRELLNERGITLCNFAFNKIMEFNPIGVVKRGEVKE